MQRRFTILLSALFIAGLTFTAAADNATKTGASHTPVSAAERIAAAPDLAVGPDGGINLIWVDKGAVQPPAADHSQHGAPKGGPQAGGHTHKAYNDLFFARSTDGGGTFSAPLRLNTKPGEVWGFATSKPRLVVAKSSVIHVFFSANRRDSSAARQAVDVRYTRSTDGGKSFETPRTLNGEGKGMDDGELDEAHCFGTMGVAPNGDVHAFWIDTRHMKSEKDNGAVYGIVSRNQGKTFEKERLVFANEACPCCQLNVAFSPEGKVYVSLRSVYADGARDATVARSDDGGRTYSQRVRVSDKSWKIAGCPLKPLMMTAGKGGRLFVAWYAGEEQPAGVFFNVSEDFGQTFGRPQRMHAEAKLSDHAAVAAGADDNVRVIWDAKVGDVKRIYWCSSNDRGKTFGPVAEVQMPAGAADYPVIAGHKGKTFVAWQLNGRVMFQAAPELVAKGD